MARNKRSNTGIPGLSYSWRRATGVTSAKRKFANYTGIPTTKSGRQAKAAREMGCMLPIISVLSLIVFVAVVIF